MENKNYLILCEGKTEQGFFDALLEDYGLTDIVEVRQLVQTPEQLKETVKFLLPRYKRIALVYDHDNDVTALSIFPNSRKIFQSFRPTVILALRSSFLLVLSREANIHGFYRWTNLSSLRKDKFSNSSSRLIRPTAKVILRADRSTTGIDRFFNRALPTKSSCAEVRCRMSVGSSKT